MITNIDRLTTRCCKETQYTEQYQYFSSHNSQKGHLVQSCQVSDKHHKDIPHKLATRCGFVLPTYKYTTKNAKSNSGSGCADAKILLWHIFWQYRASFS